MGEIYNIGGHNERTNLDVVKTILQILNKPESLIKYVEDRKGHDLRYAIDPTKIRDRLGWLPSVGFDDGISQTVTWYLDNENWWRAVMTGEYMEYMKRMYALD